MANPIDLGLRIVQALDSIGIKGGSFLGKASNIKKAMFGGKTTMFKPNAIQSIRGEGGDFGTALKLIEDEAQFIVNASDAEKMAFLNNLNDYKELGGPVKKSTSGITTLTNDAEDLQTSIKSLQDKAKTMKDDADKGLKSAEKDLKDFLETGGQPLKAKSDKYLGGSMHEEGQLRTAIRTFLRNEYKNGKIKLDETDQFRIMEYSPMMEDDPIKVFKKIYGDEAYNKAGTFPGAFEKGENFNHYELIFKENMGEDLLKVKDKKYVGDGTLTLTKQEEVFEPTPDVDDDGIPFAEGGMADVRPGFLKGKGVTKVKQIIEYITSKFTPMDAMKEVNKVIGKQGKYKKLKLTEDDINEIVEGTNDFIFQRDPDNLFVEGSIKDKTEYFDKDDVLERDLFKQKKEPDTQIFKDSEGGIKGITMGGDDKFKKAMSEAMEEGMRESENMRRLGLDPTKMEDALKYDQMKEAGQMEKNITGLSDMSEADALRQKYPGITDDLVNKILIDDNPQRKAELIGTLDEAFRMMEKGKGEDEIIEIFKNTTRTKNSKGGRAGFMDGGASIINPESSMNNSSGLNYLLGEDDNNRVDFKNGLLVPPSKPKKPQDPMMKLMETYNTYQEALPGVSQETKKYLEQDFIKKLADQGFSINDFMTYRMQQNYATGGRAGYEEGGPIHSRLGQLNTGVSSAEQQLQQINQSIEQAQNTLGSAESGGGGASAVTPSVSGYESSGSELYDSSPAGEVTNPYVAPVGMDPSANPFDMLNPKITNLNQLGPGKIDNQGQDPFRDPVTGGGQPFYGPGGGLGGLLGEGGGRPIGGGSAVTPIDGLPRPVLGGGRPIGGGPSPYAGPMKTMDQFGSNIMIKEPGGLEAAYKDYVQKYQDYNKNTQGGGLTINPGATIPLGGEGKPMPFTGSYNPGRPDIGGGRQPGGNDPFSNTSGGRPATPIATQGPSLTQTVDPYKNTMMTGLSQDGQRFDSAQSAFDALAEQTRKYREASPYTRDVIGTERYQGEEGFKNFTNYFNKINNPNYTAPQLQGQLQSSGGGQLLGGGIYNSMNSRKEPARGSLQQLADGGIAGLRQGYAGGSLVDKGRRGFLKFLGGTAAGVVALKTGLAKILGKDSGAVSKKVIDEVIIDGGSGAPAWLQPLVNKALREGTDITKNNALKDGQVVKSLDTPTGKVDVYYDTRTGEVDIDYIGGNTALGESVNMRYTPGIADEGTKGVKPADEFEAVESIPEGQMAGPDDFNIEMGENITGDVKGLYSDTSELAELGGEKLLIKDISNSIQKKRVLKQMENDPADFVTDVQGDYDPT